MKKKLLLHILLCSVIFLAGCGADNQIKLDIYQYLNIDVKPIASMHNEAVSAYNAYMEREKSDTSELLSCLSDQVIPKMERVAASLEELNYTSDEVNAYVDEYKRAVGQEMEALLLVVSAVNNQSEEQLTEANLKISDAMQAMDTYQTGVRTFAASYGLTLVEQETEATKR